MIPWIKYVAKIYELGLSRKVFFFSLKKRTFVAFLLKLIHDHSGYYILIVAIPPPTAWNIHGFNTSHTSLFVDWSNVPGSLQADFFILSMNRTRPIYEDNRFNDKDGRLTSFLRIVNSSTTSMHVSHLPVFSQYLVRVYLVDVNGEVYKSERIVLETDDWGKLMIAFLLSSVEATANWYNISGVLFW